MKYGVIKDGEFDERELIDINAKGFAGPMKGRADTYDEYVMKEINAAYGVLECDGKVVLDIGANIGCFTKLALEKGAKHVVSIEPEPNNYNMLDLNTAGHHDRVTLYNSALTPFPSEPLTLFLSNTGKNPGNSSLHARRGRFQIEVPCVSVEHIFKEHPDIEVAKIDCEGAEFDLLPRLTKYPLKQIALEFHINGFSTGAVRKAHQLLIADGWVATREPRIQENLWQTLAAYRRA